MTQFQSLHVKEQDIKKLVTMINSAVTEVGEKGVAQSRLNETFDLWWPKLKRAIEGIPNPDPENPPDLRPERELIEEILELARRLEQRTRRVSPKQGSALKNVSEDEINDMLSSFLILKAVQDRHANASTGENPTATSETPSSTSPSVDNIIDL